MEEYQSMLEPLPSSLPIYALTTSFFSLLGSLNGRFIKTGTCTEQRRRLDIARILILTLYKEKINKKVRVLIDHKSYEIRGDSGSIRSIFIPKSRPSRPSGSLIISNRSRTEYVQNRTKPTENRSVRFGRFWTYFG